jgi:hypothetical protein
VSRANQITPVTQITPVAMREMNMPARRVAASCLVAGLVSLLLTTATVAEEGWKPFAEQDAASARRSQQQYSGSRPLLPPMSAPAQPGDGPPSTSPTFAADALSPISARANAVEQTELAPVMSEDGSGLPMELWNGLDIATVEAQLARLEIPPRSAAVANLWRRLLQSDALPPGGGAQKFQALRAEAYQRSGLLHERSEALARALGAGGAAGSDAVLVAMKARGDIALGQTDAGCAAAKDAGSRKADLPKRLKGEVIVLVGYCAAIAGNPAAAGLAAELAREEGYEAATALAALDAIALGGDVARGQKIALPKRIDAIDYRLLQLTAAPEPGTLLERADPSLLWLLVASDQTEPKLRLASAEAAARINLIAPERLAEVYRSHSFAPGELVDPLAGRHDPLTRRALLLRAADAERTPQKKTRILRALLDDARRNGLYLPTLRLAAKPIGALQRQVEIGWFAETAIEALSAAERYDEARAWVAFGQSLDRPASGLGGSGLQHWLGLIDIADPANRGPRGQNLASVEQMALAGRFAPELLHRLATVLDALDYQVPIPLWEAASKTPQPATGHLPETGVLTELQDAAKKKEFGRTVLLTLRTLGPGGAEGAHMIALGDAIRALKRAGLEPDARRLGFEALFAGWPRSVN